MSCLTPLNPAPESRNLRPPPRHRPALPHALLAAAAPAYMSDTDWDAVGEDWLEQALAHPAAPSLALSAGSCFPSSPVS